MVTTLAETASRLEAKGLHVHFQGIRAVDGVDLAVRSNEIVGLIGPNGAGKTTLINALTGFEKVSFGDVLVDGTVVTRWPVQRRAKIGVARTFQSVRIFADLTVSENVLAAALCVPRGRREAKEVADSLLDRMGLSDRSNMLAGGLPYGDERRLSIARALATSPRYICLDEPAAGLNEAESDQMGMQLAGIRDEFQCGVLIVEHDMRLIMGLCERIYVLEYGKIIAIGTADQVRADARVREAYLGTDSENDDA